MTGRPALPAVGRPGIEPPAYTIAVGCITVRPLLDLTASMLPTAKSATEKTQTVFLSACLLARLTV